MTFKEMRERAALDHIKILVLKVLRPMENWLECVEWLSDYYEEN